MKKCILLLGLLVFATFAQAQVLVGQDAQNLVPGAEKVWLKSQNKLPAYIKFHPNHQVPRANLENLLQKTFGLNQGGDSWKFLKEEGDQLGQQHERFRQLFQGIPVEGSMMIVHSKNGQVISVNGDYFNIGDIHTSASLQETPALQKALDHIGANAYKWEIPNEEAHLQNVDHGNLHGPYTYYPQGELVIVPGNGVFEDGDFRLAWKFDIYAHAPLSRTYTFVDAITGEVLLQWDRIHTVDAVGTAVTAYSGTQSITADNFGANLFRLRQSGRGNGVNTWDMNEGTTFGNAVDFQDTDNNWNNVNANRDQYATDAHYAAEVTYDYFFQKYGRNSIDGAGFALNSYVHFDQDYENASWDGQRMRYGDGSGNPNDRLGTPLTSLDVGGHEITHGLTTFSAGLVYRNESGALNESFSDIFGKAIEQFARPGNFSWIVGGDIGNGSGIRNMANPNSFGDPKNYLGNDWFTGAGDNGGVHSNSGVQNYWYYLLINGGTGTNDFGDNYTVNAMGFDTASAIAFRNLTVYLTPGSGYEDARFYAIESAIDLYGICTTPHEATANAWYAVGVGRPFSFTPISDFAASKTDLCSQPYEVLFSELTISAADYTWDFGDGNTSTMANPTHTYATPGMYTVTLSINGQCGGADSEVKTSFIQVTPAPSSPTSADQTVNCQDVATLVASGTDNITWFDALGAKVGTGDTLVTGNLSSTTTFYAVNGTTPPSIFGGPADNSFGAGGIFASDGQHLIFDVTQASILKSVKVIAQGAGSRTVEYRDAGGNVLESRTVNVPNGVSRIQLDMELLPGTGYQLGVNGNVDLYRNNNNSPSYPYTVGTYATIRTSSAGNGFYYFFYDWEISEEGCSSAKTPVMVTVLPIADPVASDVDRCGSGTVTFSAQNSATNGRINWYDATGNFLATGNTFTTPVLSTTTSYLVEAEAGTSPQKFGPVNGNAVGGGGYHNTGFNARLFFEILKPVKLKSVWVDAGSAGDRDFILEDGSGTQLQTFTINIPSGQSRVNMNLDLQPGSYAIGGTQMDLFRNNSGANYPYQISGLVSITGSNANTANDFYYYLYDWEVQEEPCLSDQVTVTANVVAGTAPVPSFTYTNLFSNYQFTDQSTGASSWLWDFGDGSTSTQQNPSHAFGVGTFTVLLKVSNGTCEESITETIVNQTGVAIEPDMVSSWTVFPNPGTGTFRVEVEANGTRSMQVSVFNTLGQEVYTSLVTESPVMNENIDLSHAPAGTYLIRLKADDQVLMKKYMLTR